MQSLRSEVPLPFLLLRGSGGLDWVRRSLTVASVALTTVLFLMIFSVTAIGPENGPYGNELLQNRSFHQGLIIGLALTLLPIAFLLGQASRIASPRLAKRNEVLRLLGAERSLILGISLLESALLSAIGFLGGVACQKFIGHLFGQARPGNFISQNVVLDQGGVKVIQQNVETGMVYPLPTDVNLSAALMATCFILVVSISLFWTMTALLETSPLSKFGAHLKGRTPGVTSRIAAVIVLGGVLAFSFVHPANAGQGANLVVPAFFGVLVVAILWGWLIGAKSLRRLAGKFADLSTSPTMLIALRRIETNTSNAARATYASIGILALVGFAQGTRNYVVAISSHSSPGTAQALQLVQLAMSAALIAGIGLILIALVENVPQQRRQWSIQLALGVPLPVLRRAFVIEALAPMTLFGAAALTVGVVAARLFFGGSYADTDEKTLAVVSRQIAWPWSDLGADIVVGCAVIALMALLTGLLVNTRGSMEEIKAEG